MVGFTRETRWKLSYIKGKTKTKPIPRQAVGEAAQPGCAVSIPNGFQDQAG